MSRLTIVEAVKVIPVSESTLRRDLRTGKVSFTTAKNGKKVIDAAELERVYGQMKGIDSQINGNGGAADAEIRALLEKQIVDLKAQLARAETREDSLIAEKAQLLTLTDRLFPPSKHRVGWLARLLGAS